VAKVGLMAGSPRRQLVHEVLSGEFEPFETVAEVRRLDGLRVVGGQADVPCVQVLAGDTVTVQRLSGPRRAPAFIFDKKGMI